MKKKCPECGRTFEKSEYKGCPICMEPLIDIAERTELPKGRKYEVFERDEFRCQWCGASRENGAELTLDHIIPLAAGIANGGTNEMDNLQTLCKECNGNKADLIFEDLLQYEIKVKEIKLSTLNSLLQRNRNQLNNVTNENDKIELSFNIRRLEEQIPIINKELQELKWKYHDQQEAIRIEQEEQERQDLLFKKLYVNLSPIEKSLLKEHFGLNNFSDEEMLRKLCGEYSEKDIMAAIEEYKTDLHKFLNESIRFNMLPLISSELSLNNDSKQFIINHLYSNYTKNQIKGLLESINNELFNQYNSSFDNIEKSLLKRHYSLNEASDAELINYVIKNDFSIDELKNTVELSYKNVFQEFYSKLNENQKDLVKFRFKNSKKNLVNFLANNNFSFKELTDELDKTKLELFNKTFNSLNTNDQSLIERYSKVYSPNFDLINYFYENKFSEEKIGELVEMSKKPLITEVHNNLNDNEMFLLENTFENDNTLTKFMVEHKYSFKSLRKKLKKTRKRIESEFNNTLKDKEKFLLKKYFSIGYTPDLIPYLINRKYTLNDALIIADNYEKELYDEFDNNLNYDYEQILYNKFSLNVNSKNELINYLIYENYSVESMKSLVKNDVVKRYSKVLDNNSISLLCYKFKLVTPTKISPTPLKDYLFYNDYTVYAVQQSINEAKIELSDELDKKLDHRAVGLLNKELKLNKSKEEFIQYLIENYTVEAIRKLLEKYYIEI